ncbi:head maturation protease, ClpP-related [Roseicyclus sp.]|uniref:head maturation protease, ClpP-related n=1 Tax=Roseicyclus sp. TaxID=1914329 RepID=UPI003F6B9DF7
MHPYLRLLTNNAGRGSFRAEDNTIRLYDVIASNREEAMWSGGTAPEDIIDALERMSGPVQLRINSPGGSVFGAQAIVAAMREYDGKITARIDALAASAASVIAAEAAEVQMSQGSMLMIHRAWGFAMGNAEDMMATAALLEKIDGQIAATYARRAGDDHDWIGMMAAETWLDASEAVDIGLADQVLSSSTQQNYRWDLSMFKNAPYQPGTKDAAPATILDELDVLDEADAPEQAEINEIAQPAKDSAGQARAQRKLALRLKGI